MINILKWTILAFTICSFASEAFGLLQTEPKVKWNRFRGPNGSGVHLTSKAPLEWSNEKNLKWKSPLPGLGRSSPIVSGNKIFLTAHSTDNSAKQELSKSLLCIDLSDGHVIWKKDIVRSHADLDEKPSGNRHSGYAPHTVATDGTRTYAYFGTDGLFAFDFNGKQIWHCPSGSGKGRHGTGSSPIVFENFVIQNAGVESGRLLAIHKETGTEAWSVRDDALRSTLSTPIVASVDNGHELVVQMNGKVVGFDPKTGKELWNFPNRKTEHVQITSPVEFGESIYAAPSYSYRLLAIPLGRRGNIQEQKLWSARGKSFVVSPLVAEGQIHLFGSGSTKNTYRVKDGEVLLKERTASGSKFFASPVRIGDYWMALANDGQSFVWPVKQSSSQPSADPIINKLQEKDPYFAATPAVTDDEILIRSRHFLYCISEKR